MVDNQTRQGQQGVPVYWDFAGANSGTIKFFTMDQQEFDPATDPVNTGGDGTASLYVGSYTACIPQILASLSPNPLRPEISEQERQEQKSIATGTTIVIWSVGNGGSLPVPTVIMDSIVRIPQWTGERPLPPGGTRASALLGSNYSFGADASYVAWMCQGDDTSVLGQVLAIGEYNGQSISFEVPYANMQTGPQSANNIAYMIYGGGQGIASQVYTFSASGTALQRPDDIRHPPDANLTPVQYVEDPDAIPPIIDTDPPDIVTDSTFDLSDELTITWAIPDYNNTDGELRASTDKVVVWAYANAWKHGGTIANYDKFHLVDLEGSDFKNGYAFFTMLKSDWQKTYCPNSDTGLYGIIWIQYVINDQHYSQSMTTLIDFCED